MDRKRTSGSTESKFKLESAYHDFSTYRYFIEFYIVFDLRAKIDFFKQEIVAVERET